MANVLKKFKMVIFVKFEYNFQPCEAGYSSDPNYFTRSLKKGLGKKSINGEIQIIIPKLI